LNALEDRLPQCFVTLFPIAEDNQLYFTSGHIADKQTYLDANEVVHPIFEKTTMDERELILYKPSNYTGAFIKKAFKDIGETVIGGYSALFGLVILLV
jgi:hypothetical protein